jgi:4'-phosphopantetheinyl transferase
MKLSLLTGDAIAPGVWCLQLGHHGKPSFSGPSATDFEVSLSYSGEVAAVAVSRTHRIGIDLEAVSTGPIPWLVLSPPEHARLRTLPDQEQVMEFLKIWTLKEAYSKCLGTGAFMNFRDMVVSLDPLAITASSPQHSGGTALLLRQETIEFEGHRLILALAGSPHQRWLDADRAILDC